MAGLTPAVRLGRELRLLRLRHGLSQRAFVRALGLSAHSNLVQYELGRRLPPGDIIAACERLFGDDAGSLRRLLAEALVDRARAEPEPSLPRAAAPERTVPRMLPPGVADFTGRTVELRQLAALSARVGRPEVGGAMVSVIVGTAGVGKTALAVSLGRQISDQFPDGQLYLDLRGFAHGPPLSPLQALAALLNALGVPADEVPTDLDRAVGLYRSLLADRRTLVLLDNAHRADQVRPLLPGATGCLVLVTSRDRLAGLIARDGARRLTLEPLIPAEARTLLGRIVGESRVAAEPVAVAELTELCAYLPLAVRIAAANLADQPRRDIAGYVAQLRADNPLTALEIDGDESGLVRVAFESSYQRLDPDARRLFRRFGLYPGSDMTPDAAAALADVGSVPAGRLLRKLTGAHLLDEPAPGRFTGHDLLRRYATACTEADDSPHQRKAAVRRLYDWYMHRVDEAARLLHPQFLRLPDSPAPNSREPGFADRDAALAWLDAERTNLVAAVVRAAESGPLDTTWLLADALRGYFCLRLHTVDWLTVAHAGLRAATAERHLRAVVACHLSLALLHLYQSNHGEAEDHATRGLALSRKTGWRRAEAALLENLGTVHWQAGRLVEASRHYADALAVNEQIGWRPGQANNLNNLGMVYRESGQIPLAVEHFARALAADDEMDSRTGTAVTLSNLGEAYHALGALEDAHEHLTRALALSRELSDLRVEANALHTLAAVDLDAGRPASAYDHARAAVDMAAQTHDPRVQADAHNVLGAVLARRGEPAAAAVQYRTALTIAVQSASRAPEATALIGLARAEWDGGDSEEAIELARRALRLADTGGFGMLADQARAVLAHLRMGFGEAYLAKESE